MLSEFLTTKKPDYNMSITPDFNIAGKDIPSVLKSTDTYGYERAVLPSTFTYSNSSFVPNNKYTLAVVLSLDAYPTTVPKVLFELLDTAGQSRRQLILTSSGLNLSETSSSGGVNIIGNIGQNTFVPPLNKRMIIICTNTGNKGHLYVCVEGIKGGQSYLFEINQGVQHNPKIINEFRLYGAMNLYHIVGYNSFIYNPSNIIDELSTKYNLRTSIQPTADMPTFSHCYSFSDIGTVYDMIGTLDLSLVGGTVSNVSNQFDGSNGAGAVEGTGFFVSSSVPTALTGDHTIVSRIRLPQTPNASECLFHCGAYGIYLRADNRLELRFGGQTAVSDPLIPSNGSEGTAGWYQIFIHRQGNEVSVFPEFQSGIVLTSTDTNYLPIRVMNNTASNAPFTGRQSWLAIADYRLSLAQKNAMTTSTAHNMGTITTHGREPFFTK